MFSPRKRRRLQKSTWARAKRAMTSNPNYPINSVDQQATDESDSTTDPESADSVQTDRSSDHVFESEQLELSGSDMDGEVGLHAGADAENTESGEDGAADTGDQEDPESDYELSEGDDGLGEVSSSEEDNEPLGEAAHKVLSDWALRNVITHNALDDLLRVVRTIDPHTVNSLPLTARTLLKTNRNVATEVVGDMTLIRLPVMKTIAAKFMEYPRATRDEINVIPITLNCDGLPVYKSTTKSFWPVLCNIKIEPQYVFPLLLSHGPSKPQQPDFLQATVQELGEVLANGIEVDNRHVQVELKAVIGDAPARALMKCVMQYSAYFGCDKCAIRGYYVRTLTVEEQRRKGKRGGGRVTFQETDNLPLRTDASFRNQEQQEHHKRNYPSPFLGLPVDMIRDFPIDYMHQVCLGVMRKLLSKWLPTPNSRAIISHGDMTRATERLMRIKACITTDFGRKPQPLSNHLHFKATELRQFLLYTGRHVMADLLPRAHFDNFSCFSIACCILVSESLVPQYAQFARRLLKYFVEGVRLLYGERMLSYNLHTMLHLTDDAERYGSLDYCSAFPFENHLYQLKRKIQPGRNPLVQAYNRLCEAECGPSLERHRKRSKVSCKQPNNHYITTNQRCVSVLAVYNNGRIDCDVYPRSVALFDDPIDSRHIGIYRVPANVVPVLRELAITDLAQKAIKIPAHDGFYYHGVLHERVHGNDE